MDCAPTLDVVDGPFSGEDEEEDDGPEPWGRLFALGKGFVTQDLVKDEYTFGRGEECDYSFEILGGKKIPHFLALSKTHFEIYREKDKSDSTKYLVFIQDTSSNGTFLNGEKIGRNKKQVLTNDAEISLAYSKNKAFIFNDCGASAESEKLPEDFKQKYTISKTLGRGACGEVRLAFEKGTCKKFAVKVIAKKTFSVGPTLGRAAMEEVRILMKLKHPCIIGIEDVIDGKDALFIVLELVEGGELFDRVVSEGKFSESTSKLFFYQMLVAVKYLHDKGITHRDLKPENILLCSDEKHTLIKVTDFGLSKLVGEGSLMKTLCGTPSYLAPEILKTAGTSGYSKAVDCWSLGVILYIMLGGYPPFSDEITEYSLHDQICQARYSFPTSYWKNVSVEAIDMIKKLLTLNPDDRITPTDALLHPWMRDDDVITEARKLMGEEANTVAMPPPPMMPSRKRSAPSSDDDDITSPKSLPIKRPTLETTPTDSSETTPTGSSETTPPATDNGKPGLPNNVSMASTSTARSNSDITTARSNPSGSS